MTTQTYVEIQAADLIANSRTDINDTHSALRAVFEGPSAPATTVPYMFWADTTNGLLKQRNSLDDAWINVLTLGQTWGGLLPLSGGTMTGIVNMGANQITNLALGTGTAAARQQEVDLKAPIAGPSFTGDAQVNQDPAGVNSLVRRSWTEGRYVKLSGGTMTGALTLSGDATASLHPVTKQQVESFNGFDTGTGHHHDGTNSRKVLGANIDSSTNDPGNIMRSDGSGGVTWVSNGTFVPLNNYVLVTSGNPASYTIATVSGIGSNAIAVVLNVRIPTATGFEVASIRFRKNGESADGEGNEIGILGPAQFLAIVPVDSAQKFEWKQVSGTSETIQLYLWGYFQK